jgi:TRAP-type C4-dicarboxylate transport system permease small subunit
MNGATDYAVVVILVALLGWIGWKWLMRAAEKVIDSIDWITRNEGENK